MIEIAGAVTIYLTSVVVANNAGPHEVLSPVTDVQITNTVEVVMEIPTLKDPIEVYIRSVFPERADIAVATFKHENGYQLRNDWDVDNITYNTDGSADTGIAKINDINKGMCGDLDLEDYKGNIDCARRVHDQRQSVTGDGMEAWYSYVNGKHTMFL